MAVFQCPLFEKEEQEDVYEESILNLNKYVEHHNWENFKEDSLIKYERDKKTNISKKKRG